MAFENLPSGLRAKFIETGRDFGSDRTYAQAQETLKNARENEAALRQVGFGSPQIDRLQTAADAQKELGADRDLARTGEGIATRERNDAEKEGKHARTVATVALTTASGELQFASEIDAAREVDQVLHQVSVGSGSHLPTLSSHLGMLAGVLAVAPVAAVLADIGGPEAAKQVTEAKAKVDDAIRRGKSNASHTPEQTEQLDLLDGIVVDLVRKARKAARAASKKLGRPALAKLFELDLLYGRPKAKKEETKVA